ncbi:LOW QUALITY PROTEIN: hypothetical protein CVT25_010620, partial [Psilocybe cyanescens]
VGSSSQRIELAVSLEPHDLPFQHRVLRYPPASTMRISRPSMHSVEALDGLDPRPVFQGFSQCLPGTPSPPGPPNFWFNFGDSYSQTGFNATGPLPNTSNPIGNPQFPGYTAAGGENWVGFVASSYNNSVLYTYNYADSDAIIDASLVTASKPSVLSLADQVDQFMSSVASRPDTTPWTSDNALFSVWIGGNDIGYLYDSGEDQSTFLLHANPNAGTLDQNYDAGARSFLFANVPPIDRSPLMLNQSLTSQALEKSVIATFNSKLQDRVNAFQSSHSEVLPFIPINLNVKTFFWDTNAQFSDIFDNPYYFGFKDATSYGSDANMFWVDEYHPGVLLMFEARRIDDGIVSANRLFGQTVGLKVLVNTVW